MPKWRPPRPIACTSEEGGYWKPFKVNSHNGQAIYGPGKISDVVHAILFSDGSVFDAYSGWRKVRKTRREIALIILAWKEPRNAE